MIIRSITLGVSLPWPPRAEPIAAAGAFLERATTRYVETGFEVQTTRLALAPYYEQMGAGHAAALGRAAQEIEAAAQQAGIGYVSLGPVRWPELGGENASAYAEALAEAIGVTAASFFAIEVANAGGVQFEAVQSAARTIGSNAASTEGGFGNLRFAALANCPAGIPFFPAGYHDGSQPGFSIALQSADAVAAAAEGDDSLESARSRISQEVESLVERVSLVARDLASREDVSFLGVDRSPAPFPTASHSAARILEALGVDRFGAPGSLAAAATVTGALRAGSALSGFSGLMLPLLEDSGLAERAAQGMFSWTELLLYSAVCGTGLDTVPLPGDISEAELAGIILDVAALSTALGKPLTARLFPVPGLRAGEQTTFDFPYFANTVVLPTKGYGASRFIARGLLHTRA